MEVFAMSSHNTNESLTRCLAELRARYGSRGVSVNVRRSEVEQKKSEEQAKSVTVTWLGNLK